jgi:prephenate dehydrogenase
MNELEGLRTEISEIDGQLLALLNRRLELVASVREYKDAAGERWIDPEREAELLQALVAANPGPLSERGVSSIFSAVLDVLKQEVAADPRAPQAPAAMAKRPRAVERLAVVGTGLVGTSVALAAGRTRTRCRGFDADRGVLEGSAVRGALEPAASLAEAVADAELVVVAVPVGAAADVVREVLAAAKTAVVTDVASTKRPLASVADPRFVPGHPVAGGVTGGPSRASADLFDAATWFLAPTDASSAESVELVERFVGSLGARPVRTEAEAHDRLLALTSHLPHALANVLMLRVADAAAADDAPLAFAGASLREMTRLAGANAAVWSDIFLGNADEIAAALDGYRTSLDELERALRAADRHRRRGAGAARFVRLPDRAGPAEPDPRPRPRPARRTRADHPDPRCRADQPRGLRAAPRLAGIRRRACHHRRRRRQRRPRPRAPPPGGLLRGLTGRAEPGAVDQVCPECDPWIALRTTFSR